MITQDKLKELVHYDPDTGLMTRLVQTGSRALTGSIVCSLSKHGYRRLWYNGKHYFVHRLVWLYMYGSFPKCLIDHVNRDNSDNRLVNLRLADKTQNSYNRGRNNNNSTGYKGVTKHGEKWVAQITVKGVHKYLGTFETPELAAEFYDLAAQMTHGEYYSPTEAL